MNFNQLSLFDLLENEAFIETDTVDEIMIQEDNTAHVDGFKYYLDCLHAYDVLTQQQEKDIVNKIKNGDKEAKQMFIEHNLRLAIHGAKKRCKSSPLEFQDLVSFAQEGLINCIDKFNPEVSKFSTFAMYWINAAMIRAEENLARPIRLPSYLVQIKNKVNKAKSQLEIETGCEPSAQDIAERCKLPVNKVELALKADQRVFSINNEFGDDSESEGLDFFSTNEDIEQIIVKKVVTSNISEEVAKLLSSLDTKERQIIQMRYFQKLSLDRIGKEFGITREKVKQIESNALNFLKSICKGKTELFELL